jgi:FKBP-type peptidyl-prolyl cis-trans isomerase
MKRITNKYVCALLLAVLSASAAAQSAPAAKKKARPAVITAADVQALKDAIASQQAALAAQQQQIQQLSQQLQQNQRNAQQAQAAASEAAAKAAAAESQASDQQQTVVALKSDVTDLKTNVNNTALTLQETQKNVNTALESPLALHYKGVTITPGGYLDASFTRRSRALGEEASTPFNSLTMPGASASSLSEFYGSGRQSRISLLVEGQLKNVKLGGYVESDFNSAGVTSNSNSTNSYTMRLRQAFGQAAFNNGWTFTGGQQWSLVTETAKGMDNRTEALPMTIDTSYNVGFSFARQYGLRVVKNIDNKVWLGVAVENSQATIGTHGNTNDYLFGSTGSGKSYGNAVSGCTTSSYTPVGGTTPVYYTTCSPIATYSFNPSPDIVAKVVFEPGFGHYEIFGLYDRFRDRVFPCANFAVGITGTCPSGTGTGPSAAGAYNVSKNGGGFGANARWNLDHKHIVFGLHGFGGRGIGRYGAAGLADTAIHADGSPDLIKNLEGLATLEWHGKKLDVYANTGAEYNGRTTDYDASTKAYVGYGSPFFANSGCFTETAPSTGVTAGFDPGGLSKCTADTRAVIEGTLGFWYRLYNGPRGRFQYGMQYSYVTRQTWSGTSLTPGVGVSPEGLDGMVFTSFRYFLP